MAFLLSLILSLGAATTFDIEGPRPGVDVERYVFKVALSDSSDVIYGEAEITVRFTAGVDSFYFDLTGDAGRDDGMHVRAMRENGHPVPFEHSSNRLSVATDSVQLGDVRTYTIEYDGVPGDGLVISANRYGDRTFFGDNWPNRARYWLPTVDHPSDKAVVEWIVTAPVHYQIIANGTLLEETYDSVRRRTTHWRSIAPLPTKVMVVGVARFAIQNLDPVERIPIQTWVYPQSRQAGFHDFGIAPTILAYFVNQIGEFPYAKLANVQSTTRYGGMENAGAIFYNEQSVTGTRRIEATVAHEIAHQWFGDSATEADWHHIWLSEGFATYMADLYWEHQYGRDEMERRLKRERGTVLNYFNANPASPVVDTSITDPNQLLSPNAYQKGAWVLHMLRSEVGTDIFWDAVREYYRRYRDGNAVTEDLRNVFEELSGKELGWFFGQWVYRPGQPHITGNWAYDEGSRQLTVNLSQAQADLFSTSLEIGIGTDSGSTLIETVRLADRGHSFTFSVKSAPRMVELDPNTNLLFTSEFK